MGPTAAPGAVLTPAEAAAEMQRSSRRRYCCRCQRNSLRWAAMRRLSRAVLASSEGIWTGMRYVSGVIVRPMSPETTHVDQWTSGLLHMATQLTARVCCWRECPGCSVLPHRNDPFSQSKPCGC